MTDGNAGCAQREQPVFRKESIGPAKAKPLSSFDPLFQSRQHTGRPDFRFHPIPSCAGVSRLFSPVDNDASLSSVLLSIPSSASLRPLAPRPLRRFLATTDAVTPLPGLFPIEVSLIHVPGLPAILSPTTCVAPASLSHATPQRAGLPPCRGLGFALGSQARR